MKKTLGLIAIYSLPLLALAQNPTPFLSIVIKITDVLVAIIPLVITLALIYFIYGVAKYILAKEAVDKEIARDIMIYGAIGLFVIVSIWGIVGLLQDFTGVDSLVAPALPTIF